MTKILTLKRASLFKRLGPIGRKYGFKNAKFSGLHIPEDWFNHVETNKDPWAFPKTFHVSQKDIENCIFTNCTITSAQLPELLSCKFINCNFNDCGIKKVRECLFQNCKITMSDFDNSQCSDAEFQNTQVSNCRISYYIFKNTKLDQATLFKVCHFNSRIKLMKDYPNNFVSNTIAGNPHPNNVHHNNTPFADEDINE